MQRKLQAYMPARLTKTDRQFLANARNSQPVFLTVNECAAKKAAPHSLTVSRRAGITH